MEDQKSGERIVHVPRRFTESEWGGTESVVANLCRRQVEAGYRPEIHTSMALNSQPRGQWGDTPVHRYKYSYPFLGLSPSERDSLDLKGGNMLSMSMFWNLLRIKRVRIFHAHVIKRLGGQVLTAARMRKKPFVVTLHGNVFDVPEEELDDITAPQRGHLEWGKPLGMLFRSRSLLQEADAVVCVGRSEFEKARHALGHERVYFLPNGVNVSAFSRGDRIQGRSELGFKGGEFVIGCVSRIDPQKNQMLLVEAFAKAVEDFPQLRLVLAGPVTRQGYRDEMVEMIARAGLTGKVRVLPPVEPESKKHADLMAALDVFVLPSRHEPFGIVVLEAWASGKPVIASNVGGLTQLVDDGVNGLHFTNGDADSLQARISALVTSSVLAQDLAEAGAQEAREKYDWDSVAFQMEQIYQDAEEYLRAGRALSGAGKR